MRAILLLLALSRPSAAGGLDALLQRARAAEEAERFTEAVSLYRRALELQPGQYWATVQLAHAYSRLGRFDEARKTFEQAKKIDPRAQEAYIEEGYAAADAGDERQAQRDWAELIAKDTTSFVGYHHLGASLIRQGRYRLAERYLRESVKRLEAAQDQKAHEDDLMHSLIALGGLLNGQKRYAEAEALFREGVDKSRDDPPNQAQFLGALAGVLAIEGRKAQAEALFRQALAACTPKADCFRTARVNLLMDLTEFYARDSRKAEAEEALDQANRLYEPFGDVPLLAFPVSVEQLEAIGESYADLGNDAKAEDVYRRVIALRPSMKSNVSLVRAEEKLAELCARRGRAAEARRLYDDALQVLERRQPLAPRAEKRKAEIVKALAALK